MLSRGAWVVLLWLGAITFLVVLISTLLLAVFNVAFSGSVDGSVVEDFWQSLLRVIDPGTMAGDVGWGRRLLALLVTFVGLLIAGTLIGLIAAGIEQRVERLQRGRSMVIESGHYVVLGWSDRLRVVINQLLVAGTDGYGGVVVVLADRDGADMSFELRLDIDPTADSRVVFRSGDPRRRSNLELANVAEARGIIVLADDDHSGDGDVITTVLALGGLVGFEQVPIVAEVSSQAIGDQLRQASGPSVHPIVADTAAARVAALVLNQPGLSHVIEELTDARGCGIHLRELPELTGSEFSDAVLRIRAARPIGVLRGDASLELNPPATSQINEGDRIVAIAPTLAALSAQRPAVEWAPQDAMDLAAPSARMSVAFVGWNQVAPAMLSQFDLFASPGSQATIFHDPQLLSADDLNVPSTTNFEVAVASESDPMAALGNGQVTSIVLLGYGRPVDPDDADGRTLLNLMLLKEAVAALPPPSPQVLIHLYDADRAGLVDAAAVDDFVISDAVGSRLISQFARSPVRRAVFLSLYAQSGPSLHLISATHPIFAGADTFGDVVIKAYSGGLIALGWLADPDGEPRLMLCPEWNAAFAPNEDDRIVVIG